MMTSVVTPTVTLNASSED